MLTITEWHERYEVGFKGGEPKEGDALRVSPLRFIRLKVHGHQQGAGYRRLLSVAGNRSMEVFGIFCKFLEISGNQPRDMRGSLYNEKGNPASLQDLAFILSVPVKQIAYAVKVLCGKDIGWVAITAIDPTEPNLTELNITEGAGNFPKLQEISGNPEKAKPVKQKYLEFVLMTVEEYGKLGVKFGEQGRSDRIAALNDYIGSKGRKYKSHYHTILSWDRRNGGAIPAKPGSTLTANQLHAQYLRQEKDRKAAANAQR